MHDPVVNVAGHTYERQAIRTWYERRVSDPLTNCALRSTLLIPNLLVRSWVRALPPADSTQRDAHGHIATQTMPLLTRNVQTQTPPPWWQPAVGAAALVQSVLNIPFGALAAAGCHIGMSMGLFGVGIGLVAVGMPFGIALGVVVTPLYWGAIALSAGISLAFAAFLTLFIWAAVLAWGSIAVSSELATAILADWEIKPNPARTGD